MWSFLIAVKLKFLAIVFALWSFLIGLKILSNCISPVLFFNCSQTMFVAIILGMWSFLMRFFSWQIFPMSFDRFSYRCHAFDLSSSKMGWTGCSQRALSSLRAFQRTGLQVCDSQKLKVFWRRILMVWRAVVYPPPPNSRLSTSTSPLTSIPPLNTHPYTSFR